MAAPLRSDMVLTQSQSEERTLREQRSEQEKEQKEQKQGLRMEEGEDQPTTMPVIDGVTYSSLVAFDDVALEDFRTIGNILLFQRQTVLADA